jgi:hypothetical protein
VAQSEAALRLQLWRIIAKMEQCDELFDWLLNAIVERFGVQIAQLWTCQADDPTCTSLELRLLVHRDLSPPWNMLTGAPTAAVAQHLLKKQRNLAPQSVQIVYPVHIAMLLQRYGVNYCAGFSISGSMYLPTKDAHHKRTTMEPRMLAVLIFSRHPLCESITEVPLLLQQALVLAERQQLVRVHQPSLAPQPLPSTLHMLVPRHTQNVGSNPLALSVAIADKHARLLYSAIDDHKTIAALAAQIHFGSAEMHTALQVLLKQGRIQLYEPGNAGKCIDAQQFFTPRGR